MDTTSATTTLRAAGLDVELAIDALFINQPWSPDAVTTVPVFDGYVEQWRIEDALRNAARPVRKARFIHQRSVH